MKRIVFLVVGMLLLVANTAEARRARRSSGQSYTYYSQPAQQTQVALAAYHAPAASDTEELDSLPPDATSDYSTRTAQGVANLMAAKNYVGHFGGNPGYEGCGCGATPAAAYSICCYGNSGMATVDVGYARSASGMWYCCRRYR